MTGEKGSQKGGESRLQTVSADESGVRLDRWFKRRFPGLSHGHLEKWLRKGWVRVDGKRAESSTRLQPGAQIRMPSSLDGDTGLSQKKAIHAQPVKDSGVLLKNVLYEDDDLVVLNKPAGLAVQGGTGVGENLDDSLMVFSRDGTTRPRLVHRLDKETSGVIILARTVFAATSLSDSFRRHRASKIYWAAVHGVPKKSQGRIEAPLLKSGARMRLAQPADKDKKEAESLYRVIAKADRAVAFLALCPRTGRTHQLRVHMAHLGTPILGDSLYGERGSAARLQDGLGKGLHLHARRLMIPHPRGGMLDIVAPLGPEMQKTWRFYGFDEEAETLFPETMGWTP